MVDLADIHAAQARLRNRVRRTPLVEAAPVRVGPWGNATLWLKLECLQVTGSFKARGAVNKLLTLGEDQIRRGLITASSGNHGLGVAYAGRLAGAPATVYLPNATPPAKAEKLELWGATVVREGAVWDEANEAALARAEQQGMTYMHPFADPAGIAGQGTIGLEILQDGPAIDLLVIPIGGGGLIAGVATAAKERKPSVRVIGVEPVGAPTLYESVKARALVDLPEIKTSAGGLAAKRSAQINLDLILRHVDDIVLVDDEDMRKAARWLWFEMGIGAELSGAAAVAAVLTRKRASEGSRSVCAIVSGTGTDGIGDSRR